MPLTAPLVSAPQPRTLQEQAPLSAGLTPTPQTPSARPQAQVAARWPDQNVFIKRDPTIAKPVAKPDVQPELQAPTPIVRVRKGKQIENHEVALAKSEPGPAWINAPTPKPESEIYPVAKYDVQPSSGVIVVPPSRNSNAAKRDVSADKPKSEPAPKLEPARQAFEEKREPAAATPDADQAPKPDAASHPRNTKAVVKRDGPLVITPTVQHAPKPIVEQKREQVAKLDTVPLPKPRGPAPSEYSKVDAKPDTAMTEPVVRQAAVPETAKPVVEEKREQVAKLDAVPLPRAKIVAPSENSKLAVRRDAPMAEPVTQLPKPDAAKPAVEQKIEQRRRISIRCRCRSRRAQLLRKSRRRWPSVTCHWPRRRCSRHPDPTPRSQAVAEPREQQVAKLDTDVAPKPDISPLPRNSKAAARRDAPAVEPPKPDIALPKVEEDASSRSQRWKPSRR